MAELEKFDPSTLMQGVKDRIKSTFVSLIPDDQWESMVKKEVDDFFRPVEQSGYHREYKSPFQVLVRQELNNLATSKLKELLDTEFKVLWNNGHSEAVSSELKKFMLDNAGQLMMNMFNGMLASAMGQLQYNITQQNRGY